MAPSPGEEVETPKLYLATGTDSTRRHGTGPEEAYATVCSDVGVATKEALFRMFPALGGRVADNDAIIGSAGGEDADDPHPWEVGEDGPKNNLSLYVVHHDGAWAPVVALPQGKRLRLAFCCHVSCAAYAGSCIHAKIVDRLRREEDLSSGSEPDTAADVSGESDGADADDPGEDEDAGAAACAGEAAEPPNSKPRRRRRARSMFLSRWELLRCYYYHAECELHRGSGTFPRMLQGMFVQEWCFVCVAPRGQAMLSTRKAHLCTHCGRMVIDVADWKCNEGHPVPYDGADNAFFAFERKTVYTRVFLVALLETCVTGRTKLSAAAELWTSTIRTSKAYKEGEFVKARR